MQRPSMLSGVITPPTLENEEQSERARHFHYVTWVIMSATTAGLVGVALTQMELAIWALTRLAFVCGIGLAGLVLNRYGRTQLASLVLVGTLIVLVTVNSFSVGG